MEDVCMEDYKKRKAGHMASLKGQRLLPSAKGGMELLYFAGFLQNPQIQKGGKTN